MKKILSKLLICILITLIISNSCMTNFAYAASVWDKIAQGANAAWGVVVEFIEDILGTVVGIFAIIPKIIVLPLALSTQSFMASIAYSQGVSDADGNIKNATVFNPDTWFLSPFDIIFNKVALVDVNIFNIPTQPGAIQSIRTAAASWYYIMRIIASAILLCILVYVGIRMAISTVASDKAAYKKMLTDWAVSLALIFLMQYIIVFTFAVNTAFVKALAHISRAEGISNAILKLYLSAAMLDIDSIAATVVICMLTWQTISLLISYISRMLKVTFLVIISPLITLTYSIDKMGDGKAQALNTWLKEFIFTVLLQPFHCVIYVAFIGVAMEILGRAVPLFEFDNNNIGTAVLCILCIHFTKEAEKILGKIFNFADSTSGASLATGMLATAAIAKNAKNIGKGARKVVNTAKNAAPVINNARITMGTMAGIMAGKSASDAKKDATQKVNTQNAHMKEAFDGMKDKVDGVTYGMMARLMTRRSEKKEFEQRVDAETARIKQDVPGMSESEARAHARSAIASEDRRNRAERKVKRKESREENKRNLKKAVTYFKQTDTAKILKEQVIPSMISTGMGVFVGAGSFGVGGDAIQSIMLGTSTASGTNEFFKTSSNNLAKENAMLMQGAGVRSDDDAKAYMQGIAGREDELKKADETLEKLYNEIKAQLSGLSPQEQNKLKGTIRNVVTKTMTENPGASNAEIMNALADNDTISGLLSKGGASLGDAAIQGRLNQAIDLQRDSKIYSNISTVQGWGLNPGVMMDDSIKQFNSLDYTPVQGEDTATYEDNPPTDTDGQPSGGENQPAPGTEGQDAEPAGGDAGVTEIPDDKMQEIIDAVQPEVMKELDEMSEEHRQELQEAISDYKLEIEKGTNHADAAQRILEHQLSNISEEAQTLAKRIIEDEKVIRKLVEANESLENIVTTYRRKNSGGGQG